MGFGATLKDAGVSTEVGATSFGRLLQKMQTDTEKFAAIAGVSIDEFASKLKNEPVEAIKMFLKGLNKIQEDGGSTAAAIKSLGLNGARASQTILALSGGIETLEKNLKTSSEAFEDTAEEDILINWRLLNFPTLKFVPPRSIPIKVEYLSYFIFTSFFIFYCSITYQWFSPKANAKNICKCNKDKPHSNP